VSSKLEKQGSPEISGGPYFELARNKVLPPKAEGPYFGNLLEEVLKEV